MSRDGPGSERLVLDEDDDAPILPAAREDSVLERARRLLGRQAGGSGSFDDGAEDDGPSLGSGPSGGAKDSDAQPLVAQPDGPADGAASVPSTPAMAAVQDDAKSVSDTPRAWGAGGAWAAPGSQASGRGKAGQDDAASVGSGAGDGGSDLTASLSTMNKGLSALYLGGSGAASAKGSEAPGGRHSQDIVGDRLAAATRTPVRQPSRAPQWDSSPPGSLPTTVEACHATIRAQRSQVVELGARVAQLEQGNNRLRETGISLRVQAGQDASALEIARQRLEEVEAEAQKLRKERDLLLQRVQEQTRRARDAATRATEMQISLGSLGRDAAFGFASPSPYAPPAPTPTPARYGVQVPREGFFTAIREGIVLVKHCGWPARPHKRLVWLDVSDGDNPTLRWGPEGGGRSGKQSRSLGLRDIQQFAPGISSQILRRYGRSDQAGRYMSFFN
ncbi:hypothetical protein FNF28_01293 [Cafeteria roenbergensis]|uniref:Uncharacterized protein n=1 Tax=Cafeteria roenbergensis TaxID=33653 RepID=A0A5A8E495_CAFRO|nr:hypothetical protein FNF28_01293 [Cafeteria roenbergensis]